MACPLPPPEKNITDLVARIDKMPSFSDPVFQNSFVGYKEKLHQIKEFNDVTRYRVVFIGVPGKGKTTAICNWLGLLKPVKVGAENYDSLNLLKTAAGRTTIAEVHIDQVDGESSFDLEYVPQRQQISYIREYCESYYKRVKGLPEDDVHDDTQKKTDEVKSSHEEIKRAIRNMANLKNVTLPDIKQETPVYKEMHDVVSKYNDSISFTNAMLKRINLPNRQVKHLTYNTRTEFTRWLPTTFAEINDCKNPNTSIANRIYIHISKKDLDLHLPEYVCEIIDTMGMDGSVRPDLLALMQAKDTICYIMDDLNNLPTSDVCSIIRDSFTCENDKYRALKCSIFVKCTDDNLRRVNEANDDEEEGKKIKLTELDRHIKESQLRYEAENTLFIDTVRAYDIIPKRRIRIDPKTGKEKTYPYQEISQYYDDVANEVTEEINDHIGMLIESLHNTLADDALQIERNVRDLKRKEASSKDQQTRVELVNAQNRITAYRDKYGDRFLKQDSNNYAEKLVNAAVWDIPWQTVRKMNKCYGGYQTWHTNIFDQMSYKARSLFADDAKVVKAQIIGCFKECKTDVSQKLFQGFEHKLDAEIEKCQEQVRKDVFEWTYKVLFYPETDDLHFWHEVNLIKGNGYRNQVRGYYQGYVDSKDATKTIRELLYNHEIALFNAVLKLIHI